jgi:hypothetical protein
MKKEIVVEISCMRDRGLGKVTEDIYMVSEGKRILVYISNGRHPVFE